MIDPRTWDIAIGPAWRVLIEAGSPHHIRVLHRGGKNAWTIIEDFRGTPRRLQQIFAERQIPISGEAARALAQVPEADAPRDKPERELPKTH